MADNIIKVDDNSVAIVTERRQIFSKVELEKRIAVHTEHIAQANALLDALK